MIKLDNAEFDVNDVLNCYNIQDIDTDTIKGKKGFFGSSLSDLKDEIESNNRFELSEVSNSQDDVAPFCYVYNGWGEPDEVWSELFIPDDKVKFHESLKDLERYAEFKNYNEIEQELGFDPKTNFIKYKFSELHFRSWGSGIHHDLIHGYEESQYGTLLEIHLGKFEFEPSFLRRGVLVFIDGVWRPFGKLLK